MTQKFSVQTHTMFKRAAITAASVLAIALVFPFQASAAMLSQQLDLGESNGDVTTLQMFLANNTSFYPEALVTGYYGNLTFAAVSRFQTANNLASVGRVGPQTLAAINGQIGGGTVTGVGSDVSAPIIYPETLSTGPNSAVISWTMNEAAKSRVMYGTTWPFLYATAPSVVSNTFSTTASITLSGLQSHTTYYYVRESVDLSGNVTWTVGKPLTTQ